VISVPSAMLLVLLFIAELELVTDIEKFPRLMSSKGNCLLFPESFQTVIGLCNSSCCSFEIKDLLAFCLSLLMANGSSIDLICLFAKLFPKRVHRSYLKRYLQLRFSISTCNFYEHMHPL
jgi:hypothetical protein